MAKITNKTKIFLKTLTFIGLVVSMLLNCLTWWIQWYFASDGGGLPLNNSYSTYICHLTEQTHA
ncbi:hypothetical protein [Helicobacter sp. 16-1353]|uniref:hypothetical protein n=1 Tax=Helicobacter sp. 16-1353 TaxID=2004996 RepID=UPI0011BE7846|nr:hypothetical protein [Helicobacter sp. 16-1353]